MNNGRVCPPLVTLHVWQVPRRRIPHVVWRVARDRDRLRRTPGVRFAKLLGTGAGASFAPARPDLTRWATLVVWDEPTTFETTLVGAAWRSLATAYCRLELTPTASRGRWAGAQPFGPTPRQDRAAPAPAGPALAITRARLRPSRAARFWRAATHVGVAARTAPGLLAAFGIGEAPLGWQGTVSLWRSSSDLVDFTYHHPVHRAAIEGTARYGWYAEELFARFTVHDISGDHTIIGCVAAPPANPSGTPRAKHLDVR